MDYFSTLGAPEHRSLAEALGPLPSLAYWGPLTEKGREVSLPTRSKLQVFLPTWAMLLCRGLQVLIFARTLSCALPDSTGMAVRQVQEALES